jgi:uncharacterized membrane protein YphA (DoxX/SURF4 family)
LGLALGVLFVYASLDKIAQPADFARIVYHYRLIGPDRLIPPLIPNLLAVTLPWIELLVGLLLAAGVWRREAAGLAAGLLVVFLVAVGAALYRGIDIENCGCFSVGAGGRGAGVLLLAEDTAMLAVALTLWRWRSRRSPAD